MQPVQNRWDSQALYPVVHHPEWDVYPVRSFAADVDWGVLYGPEWAAMKDAEPASVVLAAGSAVSVYPKG